ncbi:hypothetical protein LINGRAPRIM_LOCUS187, partial [Linum grandiflorum]
MAVAILSIMRGWADSSFPPYPQTSKHSQTLSRTTPAAPFLHQIARKPFVLTIVHHYSSSIFSP